MGSCLSLRAHEHVAQTVLLQNTMPTATSTATNVSTVAKSKSNGAAVVTSNGGNGAASVVNDPPSSSSSAHDSSESETTWFQRTCADLSERKLADPGDPNSVMKAVVAKSSVLWDNKKVCLLRLCLSVDNDALLAVHRHLHTAT